MTKLAPSIVLASSLFFAVQAGATPSTTYWAPSTTYVQGYLVPHVTYDTYFDKGADYPVTTGLTMGVLPWQAVQLEVGFDLVLPSDNPALFNAKLGTPEDTFFGGSPSLAVGIMGIGTKSDVTNYDMLYGAVQKNLPWGGYVSVGGYYGAGAAGLWTGSDGEEHRIGFMGSIASPDIVIDIPGLKKIVAVADIQTGKNAMGAGGFGLSFYFTDSIAVLTGPVFFLDSEMQPGKSGFMWTMQLDIDVTLLKPAPAPPAAAQAAPVTTATK